MSMVIKRFVVVVGICTLASCGAKTDPKIKATIPVKGEVYVDGKPAAGVVLTCESVQGMDTKAPSTTSALTKEDGTIEMSTYKRGDGVPEGEYVVSFYWGTPNLMKGGFSGPDKLKDRYKDPKKSKVRFKAEGGKPVDLGKIELTTK